MSEINIDAQLTESINIAFQSFGEQAIPIKTTYYNLIKKELDEIEKFLIIKQHSGIKKIPGGLSNPYAPEYGFSPSDISYQILEFKKNSSIMYNKLNKILSLFREGQEINYSLYIKSPEGRFYRYEVPESEIDNFTAIVQSTTFKADEKLRQYATTALDRMENGLKLSEHIEKFLNAVDSTGLKIKLADKYEGFEYHYQRIDAGLENFTHGFNIEGIKKWYLGRGHDVAGWWVRGDIGLTSVKSVNLQNKYLFLNLASQKSLSEVYSLLKEIFADNLLTPEKLNKLIRAFTPLVYDAKRGISNDVDMIVNNLLNSLTK